MGSRKSSLVSLEVVHSWGGTAQGAELLDGTADVTLGDAPATFLLPSEALSGRAVVTLARPDADAWTVCVPAGASATIEVTGKPVELASLPCDEEGARLVRIASGDRAEIVMGDHSFFVRGTMPADALAKAPISIAQHRWLVPSLALHAAFLLGVFLSPPSAGALVLDLDAQSHRDPMFHIDPTELPPDPPQPAMPGQTGGASEGQASQGETGTAGAENEPRHTGGQVRVRGNGDDRRVPLTPEEAAHAGILGTLAQLDLDSQVTSPFGAAEARGFSENDAYGSLEALVPGFGPGHGGLGMIGGGHGGCAPGQVCTAQGTVGVGNLNVIGGNGHACSADQFADLERRLGHSAAVEQCTGGIGVGVMPGHGHTARVPPAVQPTVTINSSLSREEVRRVIQRHTAEVRGCYEQGLIGNPDLSGRVTVRFIVTPTGAVSQSMVDSSATDLPNATVSACISNAVTRWAFPESDGVTMVGYPFRLDTN